jgi:polysaccharide biosynthesis transport protein
LDKPLRHPVRPLRLRHPNCNVLTDPLDQIHNLPFILPVQNGSSHYRGIASGPPDRGEDHPPAREIREYLDVLRRRWWLVVAAGLLAVGATWWNDRGGIPVYTASVLLEQRGETPVMGRSQAGPILDFGTQAELIRSRAVAAGVMDSLGLQLRVWPRAERVGVIGQVEAEPNAPAGPYLLSRDGSELLLLAGNGQDTIATTAVGEWIQGPGFRLLLADPGILEREPLRFSLQNRQTAVDRVQRGIRVEPGRGPSLVRIRYTSVDPEIAAAVVNGVASAYQRQRAELAREAAGRRREVISRQLVQLADSLEVAQSLVVEYQRASGGLDPSFQGGQLAGIVLSTENEVRTLRFQESLLESLVLGLRGGDPQRQVESVHRILALGGELIPAGPTLHARLQELETDRSRLTASRFGRTDSDPQVEVIDSLIASTRTQIRIAAEQGLDHLRVRLGGAEQRLATLRAELGATPGRTAELARLRQRADAVQDVVDVLVDRYFEAQIAEAVESGSIAVVDPATVPLWPDGSQPRIKYLLSLIAGLMVGVFGAFVVAYFDNSVRRSAQAKVITGLPLLGMVPRMPPAGRNELTAAIGKEAFRAVRTNLRFGAAGEPRIISLTSATPQEGKSTVAVNLATTLAEQGSENVLLIDADLRRPIVHQVFGTVRKPGLTDLLQGKTTTFHAIRNSGTQSRLHILPCGSPVDNPAELLGTPDFPRLLEEFRTRLGYGYVVIDSPPVLAVTDGVLITQVVEGTILVVRANHVDRGAVAEAMEQLRRVNATLVGVILNAVDLKSTEGRHYYGYQYQYITAGNGARQKVTRHLLTRSGGKRD